MSDVGIVTGPLLADPAIWAQGNARVPATAAQEFDPYALSREVEHTEERLQIEGGPLESPSEQAQRDYARVMFGSQGIPVAPSPVAPPIGPVIPKAQLEGEYGIPGVLKFDADMPEEAAQSLHADARDRLKLQEIAAREPGGVLNTAARLGVGFVSQALDPLNIAAGFVPGLSEARYAEWLASAGSSLGRFAIRAGAGALQGAAGQVPLEVLRYSLSREDQNDWSASQAMLNIAYGGALFGGLHAGAGAVGDLITGRFRASPEAALIDRTPELQEATLRTALSQVATGQPVEVRPIFDVGRPRTEAEFDRETAALRGESSGIPWLDEQLNMLRGRAAMPAQAPSLMTELRRFGPIRDENGELAALDVNSRTEPGLVSKSGRSLDDAALHLWERGYFAEMTERPTINDLLDAIREERSGNPRYRTEDLAQNASREAVLALSEELDKRGISLGEMSNGEIADALGARAMGGSVSQAESEALMGAALDRASGAADASRETLTATPATRKVGRLSRNPDGSASLQIGEEPAASGAAGGRPVVRTGAGGVLADETAALEQSIARARDAGLIEKEPPELAAAEDDMRRAGLLARLYQAGAQCLTGGA